MKHLIKTTNVSNLNVTDYNRITWDTSSDKIYCIGGGGRYS